MPLVKEYLGLAVCVGVLTGTIEAFSRHRTGALVLFPFTALVYALAFLTLMLVICMVAIRLRRAWIARAGACLVVGLGLANLVRAVAPLSISKTEAVGISCAVGLIWLSLDKRARDSFAWTLRTHVVVFTVLIGAMFACAYGSKWKEQRELAALPAPPRSAPNVLLIIADTVRADHLSSYGYSVATSPAIDALGTQGIRFEWAIAASSWTLPSHASMLTGRYPHEHGAVLTSGGYDGRFLTLPEYLGRQGYRTAAFSANTFFFCRRVGLDRGFMHFSDDDGSVAAMFATTHLFSFLHSLLTRMGLVHDLFGRQRAGDINRAAVDWISSTGSQDPFFVVLNYFDAHDPYDPPEPQRSRFSRFANASNSRLANAPKSPSMSANIFPEMSAQDWQQEIDLYDGGINVIDEQIAKLTAELDRMGLLQNTLVVITSDHGESFGEHGTMLHGSSLYRQQTHVPLLIRWPGHIPARTVVEQPVSTASLAATIATLATGHSDPSFSAPSLDALWTNPPISWPPPISELARIPLDPRFRNYKESLKSITTDRWYCVKGELSAPEIYDADDHAANTRFDDDPRLREFLGTGTGVITDRKSLAHQ